MSSYGRRAFVAGLSSAAAGIVAGCGQKPSEPASKVTPVAESKTSVSTAAADDVGRVADTLRLVGAFAYAEASERFVAYGLKGSHVPVLIVPEGSRISEGNVTGQAPESSELQKIHLDFGDGSRYQVFCLDDARIVVSDSQPRKTPMTQEARRYLPRITHIAKEANGGKDYTVKKSPPRGIEVNFNGGWLEPAPSTTAKGTGKLFQYESKSVKYGKAQRMTDIVDYRKFQTLTLDVYFGEVKAFRVQPPLNGGVMWLANLSTDIDREQAPQTSPHSSMYFDLVVDAGGSEPGVKPVAVTTAVIQKSVTKLSLPCLPVGASEVHASPIKVLSNPPDSEFCLQAML